MIDNSFVLNTARELGFTLTGFSPASELSEEFEHLSVWLKSGYQAGMSYMEKNKSRRRNIKEILPSAESVISLGLNYYVPGEYSPDEQLGKVSRYAWGKDYHLVIWQKLKEMIERMKSIDPGFEAVSYVDTGPVMDKAWAVRSGLGWLGKHSNVINRQYGSWFFIANIICNRKFEYSRIEPDHCGSCTACIDACPTSAIVEDYIVDANKCISYLTIENKGEIPLEFKGKMDNWIFGCDICQDVCPWNNKFSAPSETNEFYEFRNKEFTLTEIKQLSGGEFKRLFRESPILRSKLKGLTRNAEFVLKKNESKDD